MSTVLAWPDTHTPFEHQDALDFLLELKRQYKPDQVVCLGDEADCAAISNYEQDPDGMSGGDEYNSMLEHLKPFYKAFPVCRSMHSNHTARPFRRAAKFGIPSVYLKSYAEFMQAPAGWSWHDEVEIDGVAYFHGEGFSGALGAMKAAQSRMQSCVIGHLHSWGSIMYNANPRYLFYGMNAGCLIDHKKYAFNYGKHCPAKPILSAGIVRNGTPILQPMYLDKHGRWTGRL